MASVRPVRPAPIMATCLGGEEIILVVENLVSYFTLRVEETKWRAKRQI
jgi:hypothetical protein